MIRPRTRLLAGSALGIAVAAGALVTGLDDERARPAATLAAPNLAVADQGAGQPVYGSELPANWAVADEADLGVRADPSPSSDLTGSIDGGTSELSSTGRIARRGDATWRELKVPGATTGWVDAARLVPMAPPEEPSHECRVLDGREVCDIFGEVDEGPGTQ